MFALAQYLTRRPQWGVLVMLFLVGCSAMGEIVAERDAQLGAEAELALGWLTFSLDTDGTVRVGVGPHAQIPTPLGDFGLSVQGYVEYPEKKTLTLLTKEQAHIYDLHGQPFQVHFENVEATLAIVGDGNLLVTINDLVVEKDAPLDFYRLEPAAELPVPKLTPTSVAILSLNVRFVEATQHPTESGYCVLAYALEVEGGSGAYNFYHDTVSPRPEHLIVQDHAGDYVYRLNKPRAVSGDPFSILVESTDGQLAHQDVWIGDGLARC